MIRKILLGVGGATVLLCGGGLGYGATQPSTWHVERSRTIDAAPADVLALLEDMEAWPKWAGGEEADAPGTTYTWGATKRGVGASYSWKSDGSSGTIALTRVDAEGVAYEMVMEASETPAKGTLRLAPDGAGTKVTWTDDGDFGMGPVGGLMAPMMEQALGPHFEGGLERLGAMAAENAKKRAEAERAPVPDVTGAAEAPATPPTAGVSP